MEEKNKKQNIRNLFKWEGFSKEVPWILLFLFLGFAIWGYQHDISACKTVLENPCAYCVQDHDASRLQPELFWENDIVNEIVTNTTNVSENG